MDQPQEEDGNFASLIIDGGHLAHAMGTVSLKCAKKYNMNPKDIHVNMDLLLPEMEKQLGLKFNLYQQFFYQGTTNGQPNDFHKRLRRNNITIGIHEMKIQHGKSVKEGTSMDPNEVFVVSSFMKAQKLLTPTCCLLLLLPIYTIIKIAILALVVYMEVYYKVSFFDFFKTFDITNACSQKSSIWVEKGVDVQIATKIIECAHGINGHSKSSKVCVITGDADLKSAFVCASNATNMTGNIIVLSESNCLASCLEPYLNNNKQVTLESIMESCITTYTNEFLITPRVPMTAPTLTQVPIVLQKKISAPNVEPPKLSKKNVVSKNPDVSKVIEKQPITNVAPLLKQDFSTGDDHLSLEVALKLHRFIATKCVNKPFFTIEMAQFYHDGNERLKPFVQKVKVKNICMRWNDLIITRGTQILLSDSRRSLNLINSYFTVNNPARDSYRNEPPLRDSYRNESSDDTQLLMRQLNVMWDGNISIQSFLKDKKQILELLNLSLSETLTSIKNCFPNEEPFQTYFSKLELKYENFNSWPLSKLCKEIIQALEKSLETKVIFETKKITNEVEEMIDEMEVEEMIDETEVEEMIDETEVEESKRPETMSEVEAEIQEETTNEIMFDPETEVVQDVISDVDEIIEDLLESVIENCST